MRRGPHGHRRGLPCSRGGRVQAPVLLLQASVSCLLVRSVRGRGLPPRRGQSLAQHAAPDWPTRKHQSPAARRPSSSAPWGRYAPGGGPLRRCSRPLGTVRNGACCVPRVGNPWLRAAGGTTRRRATGLRRRTDLAARPGPSVPGVFRWLRWRVWGRFRRPDAGRALRSGGAPSPRSASGCLAALARLDLPYVEADSSLARRSTGT